MADENVTNNVLRPQSGTSGQSTPENLTPSSATAAESSNPNTRMSPSPATQAYFRNRVIRPEPPTSIQRISLVLHRPEDFQEWSDEVKRHLRVYQLSQLLDKAIPRPSEDDEYFESRDLKRRVAETTLPTEYADDCYNTISRILLGQGVPQISEAANKLHMMTRTGFSSALEFIRAYRSAWTTASRLGVATTPLAAALILLNQLEADFSTWIPTVEASLTEDVRNDYTEATFLQLCDDAQARASREISLAAAALRAPQPSRDNSNPSSSTRSNPRRPPKGPIPDVAAKGPPKGTKHDKWANKMRDLKPQLNNRGYCNYCSRGRHTPLACFYLNPQLCTPGWRPEEGIWIYKPGEVPLNIEDNIHKKGYQTRTPAPNFLAEDPPSTDEKLEIGGGCTVIPAHIMQLAAVARPSEWIYDSGSARFITPDLSAIIEYRDYRPGETPYTYQAANDGLVSLSRTQHRQYLPKTARRRSL
ncbi:hypothetical protein BDW75DRAFT_189136 [Aspergillus navahoensis]